MIKTPIKQKSNLEKHCLVCGNYAKEIRRIESDKISDKNLKDLLKKYGGIEIESGIICRNCYRVVDTLDKKCTKFYNDCQKNALIQFGRFKRMASSPQISSTPKRMSIKSTPGKKSSRTKLFQMHKENSDGEDDLMAISDCDISKDEIENNTSKQTNIPNNSNSKIPTSHTDHSYVKQKSKTKKQYNVKTVNHVPQPVDHDYVTSKAAPLRYNSLFGKITNVMKENRKKENLDREEIVRLTSVLNSRDTTAVALDIMQNDKMRRAVLKFQIDEINTMSLQMKNKKHFFVSKLMKKSPEDLEKFNWTDLVEEMLQCFPTVFTLILSTMLKPEELNCFTKIEQVVPRIGLMYGVMMQARHHELSIVQRLVSMLLFDNICDQKVFDRLQVIGVSLSYSRSLGIVDIMAGHFNDQVVSLVKREVRFRIVGDNINWTVGVHDQRMDNTKKMMHAFGSAIITQALDFGHLNSTAPQRAYDETPVHSFLPSFEDISQIRRDYTILMSRVAFEHIPVFQQFSDVIPTKISTPCSPRLKDKSKVIPLPVLFKNEQYYQDVVQILDFYEQYIVESHELAGKPIAEKKIHIGGDQLTRERFSGAKVLRAHHPNPEDKFQHLSPITFELFHMHMNYLKMVFKHLYNTGSGQDLGTLKSLQDRISRSNVKDNVTSNYDADKDFFISVTDMYIVECFLEYFGMESTNDQPSRNMPPEFATTEEKHAWYFGTVGAMIDNFVFSSTLQSLEKEVLEVDGTTFTVKLGNGRTLVLLKPKKTITTDFVKNYGQRVLEFGLLFKDLLDMTHMPDRDRGLRLLKLAMVHFKSHKNLSKYAFEILRFLVHQCCILSEKEANEEFYGLFVNTSGRYDGHIPADKRMEYLVKQVKEHIKHMFSNKTESNISSRTRAISGIREIAENYDKTSSVIIRSKKHSDKSSFGDEIVILQDLRRFRPFRHHSGRYHVHFPNIEPSIVQNLNVVHFHEWIETRKLQFALESGN